MSVIVGNAEGPEATAALERAAKEAGLRGITLHIVEHILLETPAAAAQATQQGRYVISTEAGLEQEAQRLRDSGLLVETHVLSSQRGDSSFADDFLELAQRVGATLIVIGIRKRSKVGKLVLGSRAQDILLRADCAVLAVKATSDQESQ
jgi:nucleotide-binding universal stress UspA family protein